MLDANRSPGQTNLLWQAVALAHSLNSSHRRSAYSPRLLVNNVTVGMPITDDPPEIADILPQEFDRS